MKIWLSKNSEVPVREQICTQITLGITSGDLPVGEKLPSTQEIARRFKIHSNTVSNAYQKLAEDGWIEFKQGSGFFVCELFPKGQNENESLDALFTDFLEIARGKGYSNAQIEKRVQIWLKSKPPEFVVLVEPDAGFREILVDEISNVSELNVIGVSFEEFESEHGNSNAIFAAMSDEKVNLQNAIPTGKICVFLNSNSVAGSMTGQERPAKEDLIAVVSGWERFLHLSKTMLLAAEIDSESLIVRSTAEPDWRKGLDNAAMIICDSLTSKSFQNNEKVRVFPLIAQESLENLQKYL
jgi:DNA-binding transcriptional regulator YhcF (GntR family)